MNESMKELIPQLINGAIKEEIINEMEAGVTMPQVDPKYKKTEQYASMISQACYKLIPLNNDNSEVDDDMKELITKQSIETITVTIEKLVDLWSDKEVEEPKVSVEEPKELEVSIPTELTKGMEVTSPKGITYTIEDIVENGVYVKDYTGVWKVDMDTIKKWNNNK